MKKIGCLILMIVIALSVWSQKESDDLRAGNKLYKSSKFTEAEIAYRKGLVKNPKSFEATYNLGNALYKQKKFTEALEKYDNAVSLQTSDKKMLASTLHNVGNSMFAEKKYDESIKAYKMALKNNPHDDETRYNLAYAQMMLKQQQQQKKDNKDNKDQDKDKDKDQKPQNQKQKEQPQQQPQPSKSQMSKENAQQILEALQQDEKNTQDKVKKQQLRGTKKAEKDW